VPRVLKRKKEWSQFSSLAPSPALPLTLTKLLAASLRVPSRVPTPPTHSATLAHHAGRATPGRPPAPAQHQAPAGVGCARRADARGERAMRFAPCVALRLSRPGPGPAHPPHPPPSPFTGVRRALLHLLCPGRPLVSGWCGGEARPSFLRLSPFLPARGACERKKKVGSRQVLTFLLLPHSRHAMELWSAFGVEVPLSLGPDGEVRGARG